ncbi:MAG: response regulator transcription factor [Anaeromyxobacter sp.]|mgnify:FL=1
MNVLLADDHTLVRAGLKALLETIEGVTVVGDVGRGDEALAAISQHKPDVAVLDLSMPGLTGVEVAERAAKESPKTRVLMLSMHATETYVAQALRAGARGYLVKEAAVSELPLALEAISRGDTYLSPGISRPALDELLASGKASPLETLSPRQREVLRRIAEGQATKEIAFELGLSVKTVETHRAQLMERLGIRDVPGLVRLAIRAGLVSSDR